ncbi:ABC transporter substrate-binding protein [Streptomyces sp. ST2-7A]|uniref:ABC transporter substrate-binding protein n=1 Tax=Streptomyces sp. ST2-7A TaxID=2907214 RepID=UPI001F46A426|nr:ABC transporter substrate-binding protein [Streptomyces sp. ST2-7A]MCE7080328.1 ABC transporter substrate-binding protein [Streptomyces sp. ST2-7A]
MKTKISIITAAVVAAAVGLAGCAGGASDAETPETPTGAGTTAYPLTMKNCGIDVTFEAAPERVVTLNQTAAEILIHLGVGDRIVGSGYEIDKTPDEIAEQYEKIPILSAHGQEIKHEKLLEAQPDFVYGSFASMFTPAQSGDRAQLHSLGVPTYLTEFDCSYHESVAGADFTLMYEEYRRLAEIFDVSAVGEKLATEQQAVVDTALEAVEKRDTPLKVMWFYSTYAGTPWAAGPGGLPQHISDLVGIENIFADASTKWAEVSWDEVAARNPDVIILADLSRGEPNDTAPEKIDLLKKDPLTSKLDAVVNDRFVTIPGAHMDPGYGSVFTVPALVEGLNEIG